jgi:acyl-coenzyme A synthetase/AMP-(fatty) acid ligase
MLDLGETIVECFERVVACHSDKVAVHDGKTSITFSELNARANSLAWHLIDNFNPEQQPVATLLSNDNARYIDVLFAILKSGSTQGSLSVEQSAVDLVSRVETGGVCVVITDTLLMPHVEHLKLLGIKLLNVDDAYEIKQENLNLSIDCNDAVFVSYTSGSMGRPKGIAHNHASARKFINAYIKRLDVRPNDRTAILRGMRGTDLLASLLAGASVYIRSIQSIGIVGVWQWCRQHKISVLPAAPTLLRLLFEDLKTDTHLPDIRVLRLSGEPLHDEDIVFATKTFSPDCVMVNWFGSSEVGMANSSIRLGDYKSRPIVDVGQVFDDITIDIIDADGIVVADGIVGEIRVSGANLFAGYWRDAKATEKVLKIDPDQANQQVFYSGDLGSFNQQSCLVFAGRKDLQIKIRGFRIEPEEIEQTLRTLAGVHQALVVCQQLSAKTNADELVGFLQLDSENPPPFIEVKRELRARLALYKIPAYFVILDALPRLPGGKPDRAALPRLTQLSKTAYNTP